MTSFIEKQFQTITLQEKENQLKFCLKNSEKRKKLFLIFFIPIATITFLILPYFFSDIQIKIDSLETKFAALAFLICLFIFYINFIFKAIKNLKGINIEKKDNFIFLNGRKLCHLKNIYSVIIQPLIGTYGFGGTYTIGLNYENKSTPLIFFLTKSDGNIIADIISKFCQCEWEIKKAYQFSFFRRW